MDPIKLTTEAKVPAKRSKATRFVDKCGYSIWKLPTSETEF